jgi:hypothetical protein
VMPEAHKFALDAAAAPARILLGQPQRHCLDRAGGRRPAGPSSAPAVVPFARDQAVPSKQGRGCHREHLRPPASG